MISNENTVNKTNITEAIQIDNYDYDKKEEQIKAHNLAYVNSSDEEVEQCNNLFFTAKVKKQKVKLHENINKLCIDKLCFDDDAQTTNKEYAYIDALNQQLGPELHRFFQINENIEDINIIDELAKKYENGYDGMISFLNKIIQIEKDYDNSSSGNSGRNILLSDMKTCLETLSKNNNLSVDDAKKQRKIFAEKYMLFIRNYMSIYSTDVEQEVDDNQEDDANMYDELHKQLVQQLHTFFDINRNTGYIEIIDELAKKYENDYDGMISVLDTMIIFEQLYNNKKNINILQQMHICLKMLSNYKNLIKEQSTEKQSEEVKRLKSIFGRQYFDIKYIYTLLISFQQELLRFCEIDCNTKDIYIIDELAKKYENGYDGMISFLNKIIQIEKDYDNSSSKNLKKIMLLLNMKTCLETLSKNNNLSVDDIEKQKKIFAEKYTLFIRNYMSIYSDIFGFEQEVDDNKNINELQQKLQQELPTFFCINKYTEDIDIIDKLAKRYENGYIDVFCVLSTMIEFEKKKYGYNCRYNQTFYKIKVLLDMQKCLKQLLLYEDKTNSIKKTFGIQYLQCKNEKLQQELPTFFCINKYTEDIDIIDKLAKKYKNGYDGIISFLKNYINSLQSKGQSLENKNNIEALTTMKNLIEELMEIKINNEKLKNDFAKHYKFCIDTFTSSYLKDVFGYERRVDKNQEDSKNDYVSIMENSNNHTLLASTHLRSTNLNKTQKKNEDNKIFQEEKTINDHNGIFVHGNHNNHIFLSSANLYKAQQGSQIVYNGCPLVHKNTKNRSK